MARYAIYTYIYILCCCMNENLIRFSVCSYCHPYLSSYLHAAQRSSFHCRTQRPANVNVSRCCLSAFGFDCTLLAAIYSEENDCVLLSVCIVHRGHCCCCCCMPTPTSSNTFRWENWESKIKKKVYRNRRQEMIHFFFYSLFLPPLLTLALTLHLSLSISVSLFGCCLRCH